TEAFRIPSGKTSLICTVGSTSTFNSAFNLSFRFTHFNPAFDLGTRMKQPDRGVRPSGSNYPSVVLARKVLVNCTPMPERTNDLRFSSSVFPPSHWFVQIQLVILIFYRSTCCPQLHSSGSE